MASVRFVRPVVRSFTHRFAREAAAHVKAGGHALVWQSPKRALLVFRDPDPKDEGDLGLWSLLDMQMNKWEVDHTGVYKGLATVRIPRDCLDLVRERATRDSIHPGATRTMRLDCETCAACCRKNRVELEREDIQRFKAAGRADLLAAPFTRKDGRKLVLRLLKSGDCRHLQPNLRCGIYPIRPEACRSFPPASEGCLFSREEMHGISDGLPS
jgi:hypothetical protein